MRDTELAWAAGFFDGEGSCLVRKCGQGGNSRPGYFMPYVVFSLPQTDLRPLQRFQAAVGCGTIADANSRSRVAKGWKPCWRWQAAAARDVAHVIEALWPYLSEPKREQIVAARERAHELLLARDAA